MTTETIAADVAQEKRIQDSEFNLVVEALCQQRRSALVMGEDADQLGQASAQLSRVLRRVPGLQLEWVQPAGMEAVLARFNRLLDDLPLDLARSPAGHGTDSRLWVLQLSRHTELPEVQVLMRLVQSFPGAGVRLLLLCSHEPTAQRAMIAFGTRLHRWVLQPPTPWDTPQAEERATPESTPPVVVHREPQRSTRRLGMERLQQLVRPHLPRDGRRWALGVGGLMVSMAGACVAWWQARPEVGAASSATPGRRPVPEIVEMLDGRQAQVRQRSSS